jgi:hypothetical protein
MVNEPLPTLGISAEDDVTVDRLADELRSRASELDALVNVDARSVLRRRASLLGFSGPGRVSANGHSRLIPSRDGWIALSLARQDDVDLVEALVEHPLDSDPWSSVTEAAMSARADKFVARGRLLGLPITTVHHGPTVTRGPILLQRRSASTEGRQIQGLKVADLSSLWAGPLAAKILADAGAVVTKIESTTRPDGARARPEFYSTLHDPDQPLMVVDFTQRRDRDRLRHFLEIADVVIEGSRPRALEQLGLGPTDVTPQIGSVWLSITGYGRRSPADGWVAFGDDGAAAGGLVRWSDANEPSFVGDAIGDPLTGIFGALGVIESLIRGGGGLIDVSLQRSSAWVAAHGVGPLIESDFD